MIPQDPYVSYVYPFPPKTVKVNLIIHHIPT